jgi:hypothetical protein
LVDGWSTAVLASSVASFTGVGVIAAIALISRNRSQNVHTP